METLTSIFKRRSIRKFTAKPVEKAKLDMLLQAAMAAPTAKNMQDWEFLVVTSKAGKEKIKDAMPTGFVAANAPLAIIVCGNLDRERTAPGFFPQDCAAAAQNMLLAAYDMGLGSVWMGVYPRQERVSAIKKAFDLPDNIQPFAVTVFGYPDEQKPGQNRFDPDKVHLEKW